MKKLLTQLVPTILIIVGIFVFNQPALSQSNLIIPNSTFVGDILHADAGSDYIGVVYSNSGNIYYNQIGYDGIWGSEILLGLGTQAKIAIDNNDNIHVAFTSSGKIAYTHFDGNGWSDLVYIESNFSGSCSLPDIDVDNNGFPHITYTDTKGNTGDYTDRPDIMYATNSSGSFVKTLIFRGFLDYYGGADRYAEYFDKGSVIALDKNNNYYILSHKYQYMTWMGGNDKQYSVVVKSAAGTGGTPASSGDVNNIYDITAFADTVVALYKQSSYKTSQLTPNAAVINFNNTASITTTSVSSVGVDSVRTVVGGINSGKLFTISDNFTHTYSNITVKGSIVNIVGIDSIFYALYTDNADNKIKIQVVAGPVSLTSFTLTNQTAPAIINPIDKTVAIEVSSGTNPETLIANFLTTSDIDSVMVGEVKQISGTTSNDLSLSTTYSLYSGASIINNWTITVTVAPMIYSVSATASPIAGGSIAGAGDFTEGDNVTVSATANNGYAFVSWTEDGSVVSTDSEYIFALNANRVLTANFIQQYTLTINVTGTGTVNVDEVAYSTVITADSGTELSIAAIAGDEYHFVEWTGDVSSTNASESVTMDGNKTISATFAINQYTLTINVTGTGTVNVDEVAYSTVITADSGTELSIAAIAGDEYHFVEWTGDVASTNASESVTMDGNKTITATFAINQYTLTINVTGTGTINVDEAAYSTVITADSGTELSIAAIAGDEYHFVEWTGDVASTNASESVTMDGNKTISATFAINQYTLTINVTGTGTINVDEAAYSTVITADSGTELSIAAIAGDEYHFVEWTGDVASTNASESVTMDGNKTITATFAINQYTLTITIVGSGNVKANENTYSQIITVDSGTEINLEAIANTGNKFIEWSGDLISSDFSKSITMLMNYSITATFDISNNVKNISNNELTIFPNPFNSSFSISTKQEINSIVLTDLSGKIIENVSFNESNSIETSHLPNGIYLLDVQFINGKRIIKKIFKM